jgi:hypothetical protein
LSGPAHGEYSERADRRVESDHRFGPFDEFHGQVKGDRRAICPSRCLVTRSVMRRNWPKFENWELVRRDHGPLARGRSSTVVT